MKKFFMVIPVCVFLLYLTAFSQTPFSDLSDTHWAWSAVEKMYSDGRVNGYPNGEFKPDQEVTRWEFVKMTGGDPDVLEDPDRPASRDEAAEILWERAGKPETHASSAITRHSENPNAAAWAYSYGIMQGEDGFNLRFSSSLTRAEAAIMIVRAEQESLQQTSLTDTIAPVILERIWNSFQTGIPYEPEAGLTNGYLARLALQIGYETQDLNYDTLKEQPDFDGTFARDIQLVCQECLGDDMVSEEYMMQPVNRQDAVALLTFYAMKQAMGTLEYAAGQTYPDVTEAGPMAMIGLEYAYNKGLCLNPNGSLGAKEPASMKDIACILLQLDDIIGFSKSLGNVHVTHFLKQADPWPEHAEEYAYILDEIPVEIYDTVMTDQGKPVESYQFAKNFDLTLVDFLNKISQTFPSSVKAEWTLWPSLVVETKEDTVLRVGLVITENPEGLSLNQLLEQNDFTETYTGDQFIVDIAVGGLVMDVTIDAENYRALRAFPGKE